ncbi:MAG: hypothetical protein KAW12_28955 [Candidatus Aminicenantes bacterium]|nr:hypothetical protein [Candidatus Aminicenantes bacterium]
MLAIREIKKVESDTITVKVPEEFRKQDVEIIILPYTDIVPRDNRVDKLKQFDSLVKTAKKRDLKIDRNIDIDELMNKMPKEC